MSRRGRRILCTGAFAAVCVAAALFLYTFMAPNSDVEYVSFQSVQRLDGNGAATPAPLDEFGLPLGMEDGAVYRFQAQLEGLPENGYLVLETSGAAFTVRIDGETVLHSVGAAAFGPETMADGQVHIPFPPGAERCLLELDYQVLDAASALYPPLARYTSLAISSRAEVAYANLYAIPAGCFALIFVFVCGLFLLSLAEGRPDPALLVLALAAGLLAVYQISRGYGYYFLPAWLHRAFTWRGLGLLIPLLLLTWLLLGRRRGSLRFLGRSVLAAGAALLCVYLVSLARGGYTAAYLRSVSADLVQYGEYTRPLYWLTAFLIVDSAAIAAWQVFRRFVQTQADAQAMALKIELTESSYHAAEEKLRQSAALHHEWKNQVAALHLLQQQGDLAQLGRYLEELDVRLERLAPRQYAKHFVINTILQSTAARADELGVKFSATAPVPPELNVDTGDLCGLLLNMLDNALEGAAQVPDPTAREVECSIKVRQGFLAIKCENSYAGPLSPDEQGGLHTTRADREGHGFGLAQMRRVAKKYHSTLDITYSNHRFVVQTALMLG